MGWTEQAERIRRARAQHGKAGRANPYPEWLRREALEYTRGRVAEGASTAQVSRELSMPALTLARWSRAACGRFVPVVVELPRPEPQRGAAAAAVHGPCGLRIEGLDLASLAALLRALA